MGGLFAAILLSGGLILLDPRWTQSQPELEWLAVWVGPWPASGAVYLGLAIALIAGSQFVFMLFLADDACPDAPMVVTGILKAVVGLFTWASLVAAGWLRLLT